MSTACQKNAWCVLQDGHPGPCSPRFTESEGQIKRLTEALTVVMERLELVEELVASHNRCDGCFHMFATRSDYEQHKCEASK